MPFNIVLQRACLVEFRQLFYGITNLVHDDSSSHDVLIQGVELSAMEASN